MINWNQFGVKFVPTSATAMKVNPFEKKMQKIFHQSNFCTHKKEHFRTTIFSHYFTDHIPARFVSHSQKNEEKKNLNVRKWNQKKKIQEIDGKKRRFKTVGIWGDRGTLLNAIISLDKSVVLTTHKLHTVSNAYGRIAPYIPSFMSTFCYLRSISDENCLLILPSKRTKTKNPN